MSLIVTSPQTFYYIRINLWIIFAFRDQARISILLIFFIILRIRYYVLINWRQLPIHQAIVFGQNLIGQFTELIEILLDVCQHLLLENVKNLLVLLRLFELLYWWLVWGVDFSDGKGSNQCFSFLWSLRAILIYIFDELFLLLLEIGNHIISLGFHPAFGRLFAQGKLHFVEIGLSLLGPVVNLQIGIILINFVGTRDHPCLCFVTFDALSHNCLLFIHIFEGGNFLNLLDLIDLRNLILAVPQINRLFTSNHSSLVRFPILLSIDLPNVCHSL